MALHHSKKKIDNNNKKENIRVQAYYDSEDKRSREVWSREILNKNM